MSETKFTPVRGTESSILDMPYNEGYLYFAVDTKKIYLDSNRQSKIPMGGGGGAAAGSGVIIGSRQISIEEESQESIEFQTIDLNIDFLPSVDAIILNVPDGCFYRVTSIGANSVVATRLTVAGGGGGGGSSSSTKLTLDPISGIRTGQTYVLGQSSNMEFEGTVDNGDTSLIYYVTIVNSYAGNEITRSYGPFNVPVERHFVFDLGSVLLLGTNTVQVTVSSDNAGYSVKKNYSLLNCVEMYLKEEIENFNPLQYFKGDFNFYCTPVGADLTKNIDIYVDDVLLSEVSKRGITLTSEMQQFTIPGQTHGTHTLKAVLSCDESAATTELSYNICCIEDGVDAPIIWYNANIPSSIINHDKLTIEYMVYNPTHSTGIEMHYYINNSEIPTSPLEVDYSQTSWLKWRVTGYEVGDNVFTLQTDTTVVIIPVTVERDTKRNLDILTTGLHVNLDSAGRSNNENQQSRSTWSSLSNADGVTRTNVVFKDFNWYNNGWITDDDGDTCLRISNGASIEIPLNIMSTKALRDSLAFELVFKVRNVQNYSTLINTIVTDPESENPTITKVVSSTDGVWCNYYNNNIGFCLGTQEGFFKSRDTLVSGRYKEDDLVHVTFVVEAANANNNRNKLIYMYINGINSGITKYNTDTDNLASNCQKIVMNSKYCDVDLYKLRIYKTNLSAQGVVQNYLADYNSAELYDMNQEIADYNNGIPSINFTKMVQYNEDHPDALLMPYMVIETTDANDVLPFKKQNGDGWLVNVEFVNPTLDYEYNNKLWTNKDLEDRGYASNEEMYIHSCPSYRAVGVDLNVQGTSSQGYPIRNYKAKFKNASSWVYTNPNFVDSNDKPISMAKGGTTKKNFKVGKKFFMDSWIGENKTTLKADYMDSSGVHNTGFASLVRTMYSKHPLQDYNVEGLDASKLRTSVYGFPILMFHKKHDGTYKFLGRYNYNLDKGCDDTFGFCDFGSDHYVDVTSLVTAQNFKYKKLYVYNQADDTYLGLSESDVYTPGTQYFRLDEGQDSYALNEDYDPTDPYSRQYLPWSEAAECWELQNNQGGRCSFQRADFDEIGSNGLLTVLEDFEYRYHIDADSIDNCLNRDHFKEKGEDFSGATDEQVNTFMRTKMRRFERFCEWLESCNKSLATGETLETPYVTSTQTYTEDTPAYRLAKFKNEFNQHLDKEYCVVYYIMTELLICYDSRGKNLMMATWGPHERGGQDIWYPIFYDIDTQLGVNNSGVPYWDYYEEASKNGTFSTANSVLWNNLWECFEADIKSTYNALSATKITIENINGYYNFDPQVSKSKAMCGYRPIILHNVDEYQKYIAPSITGFVDTAGTSGIISDAFYYCLQGTRELQRALFLRNRFNYIGSQWQAGPYSQTGAKQGIQLRFDANDYPNTSDKYLTVAPTTEEYNAGYRQWPDPEVPGSEFPHPLDFVWDFDVTPYLKQYVSNWWDDTALPTTYASDGETITIPIPSTKVQDVYPKAHYPQQLVYFGGAEYVSSLGDLSKKYIDQFFASGAKRLRDILVGSDVPGYFNKMMNTDSFKPDDSATMVEDGVVKANKNAKTLLERVVLTNLPGLTGTLDFSGSEKLKELRALGTKVSSFILADGVQIAKLHLPETVTNLILKEPTSLTGILTSADPTQEVIEEYIPITVTELTYDPSIHYVNTLEGYKRCDDTDYFGIQYKLIEVTEDTFDPSILYTRNSTTGGFDKVDSEAVFSAAIDYYIAQNYIDYNETVSYYKKESVTETIYPDGLYIKDLTDNTNITSTSVTHLGTIDIVGGNMGYDSYTLLQKTVDIKQQMISNEQLSSDFDKHLAINIENVDWTPYRQVEYGEAALENAVYYLLNDHDNLVLYTPTVANTTEYENWALNTANGKVYEYDSELFNAHQNDITDLNILDTFINDYKEAKTLWDSLADKNNYPRDNYNFYQSTDSYAQGPTLAKLTGNIYINNDNEHPIDEAVLKNYYHDTYYPKLNIQVAHTTPALIAKFVEINETTGAEYVWDTKKYSSVAIPGEYTPPTYPELSNIQASKLNYDFRGWSTSYYTQEQIDAMSDEDVEALILDDTSVQDVLFANGINNVVKLYAIYTIHAYEVTFKYNDGTLIETKRVSVVNYIPMPSTIPYLDDSALPLLSSYVFKGYTRERNGDILVQLTDDGRHIKIKPSGDLTLYASFEEVDNIHNYPTDSKYFTISNAGLVSVAPGIQLSGKVVIPNSINGITVTGIDGDDSTQGAGTEGKGFYNQMSITHVFLQNPAESQCTTFKNHCFALGIRQDETNLKYVELPESGQVSIYPRAFSNQSIFLKDIPVSYARDFFSKIISIGSAAFNEVRFGFTEGIYFPTSLTNVDTGSFYRARYRQDTGFNLEIGSQDDPITLSGHTYNSPIFNQANVNQIMVYTTNGREDWVNILTNTFGIEDADSKLDGLFNLS